MPRTSRNNLDQTEVNALLGPIMAVGDGAPTMEQKLAHIALLGADPETTKKIHCYLLEEMDRSRVGLMEAKVHQEKIGDLLKKLTAAPYHPAIFLATEPFAAAPSAMVLHGNTRRVVALGEDVELEGLRPGDEVLLSNELNYVVQKSPYRPFFSGEVAYFDRYLSDGRLVLKQRDEELIVDGSGSLDDVVLKKDELVRWDRTAWMALESIEDTKGESLFLESTPPETFADIGGLDAQIRKIQRIIERHHSRPELAAKYMLEQVSSILLCGPPGTGKTMLARALANWMAGLYQTGRSRFMHVKPSSLNSVWFSESERNMRETFRIARKAGEENPDVPVIMFFDEIDSLASARGNSLMRAHDNVLNTFMVELNGFESRGNVLVIAATNRKDILDAGVLRGERLADEVVEVTRPDRRSAHLIFEKYLAERVPYQREGAEGDAASRQRLIRTAVSQIYSPNGENSLVELYFRDGTQRTVKMPDLINGASIAKIARIARERASEWEEETGETGVRQKDLSAAISEEAECLSGFLNVANVRSHLPELPTDVDVVRIERVRKRVKREYRYLRSA